MAKSKSHSKQQSSKSKVVRKGAQQGLAPQVKTKTVTAEAKPQSPVTVAAETKPTPAKTPAFSAANASLQKVNTPTVSDIAKPKKAEAVAPVEPTLELAPEFAATPKPPVVIPAPAKPVTPVATTTKPVAKPTAAVTRPTAAPAKPAGQATLPAQVVREVKENRAAPAPVRRTRPSVWIGAGLGALLLVVGGAAAGAYSKFASGGTIAPGVSVAGVSVGGLTPEVATQRVAAHFGQPQIALLCGDEKIQMPITELGAKLSIEPTIKKAYKIGRDGFLPNNLLVSPAYEFCS
ncbi:hypothetical protein EON83_11705 [bacterium]|nr:MAG: hypothetical protein EON83_11705 [bacterium]